MQGGLTEYAKGEKERLLAEKKEAAETKIREGIFSLLTVVASVAEAYTLEDEGLARARQVFCAPSLMLAFGGSHGGYGRL